MENIIPFCHDGAFYPGSTCSGEAHVQVHVLVQFAII